MSKYPFCRRQCETKNYRWWEKKISGRNLISSYSKLYLPQILLPDGKSENRSPLQWMKYTRMVSGDTWSKTREHRMHCVQRIFIFISFMPHVQNSIVWCEMYIKGHKLNAEWNWWSQFVTDQMYGEQQRSNVGWHFTSPILQIYLFIVPNRSWNGTNHRDWNHNSDRWLLNNLDFNWFLLIHRISTAAASAWPEHQSRASTETYSCDHEMTNGIAGVKNCRFPGQLNLL